MNMSFTRAQMLDALDAFEEGLPLTAQQKDALKAWEQKQAAIEANSSQQRAFEAAYRAYQLKVKERNKWIDLFTQSCGGILEPALRQRIERSIPLPDITRLRGHGGV